MEETVQVMFDDGALVRNGTVKLTKSLSQLKIPLTVQAILASRIDRLPPGQKDLLQTPAVLGREFPFGLVKSVVAKSEDELNRMLSDLQLGEFIYEQPAASDIEYIFKHALTQDVAANSILIEKRKLLHERTAQAIESLFADRLDDHVDQLAHHYAHSDDTWKAVKYLHLAGQRALERSAPAQAVSHMSSSLDLLMTLPETPERDVQELVLQTALSGLLLGTKGDAAPEVVAACSRAVELCHRMGATPQLFPAQFVLTLFYMNRGQHRTAQELAKQLLHLAQVAKDPAYLLAAHTLVGVTSFLAG